MENEADGGSFPQRQALAEGVDPASAKAGRTQGELAALARLGDWKPQAIEPVSYQEALRARGREGKSSRSS